MRAKKVILVIAAVIVVIFIAMAFVRVSSSQGDLHYDDTSEPRAFFPRYGSMIEMFDNALFTIDTGSSYSEINPATVQKLRDMGLDVVEHNLPMIGSDSDGNTRLFTSYYEVTLPVERYNLNINGENGRIDWVPTGEIFNLIHNVKMAPAADGAVNRLGIDVLEHFVLEYQYFRDCMVIRTKVEENYEQLADMECPWTWDNLYECGHRYFVKAKVDQFEMTDYFINTGLDFFSMRLPIEDTIYCRRKMTPNLYHKSGSVDEARLVSDAWIEMGLRSGSHGLHFASAARETHAINPVRFFTQDVAMDFKKRKIYLRPFTNLYFHHTGADQVASITDKH